MAEERLPCRRSASIEATSSDSVTLRVPAISLRQVQNASSRLTLVLCPAMTIERLTTGDFMARLLFLFCAHRYPDDVFLLAMLPAHAPLWCGRTAFGSRRRAHRRAALRRPCEIDEG